MNRERVQYKKQAAERAVEFIQSGMVVGLGHGTTAVHAVRRIAEEIESGRLKDIRGVPCSKEVEKLARSLNIPLLGPEDCSEIDLTIDGADEVDPEMNLIKGGGGALLREKIVAQASKREIIIVDDTKLSPALGIRTVLPVVVAAFGWRCQAHYLAGLGAHISLRRGDFGVPFVTDEGHLILDCDFGPIRQAEKLADMLARRAGIVEHGLFLGLATDVILAGQKGLQHFTRADEEAEGISAEASA